MSLLVVSDSVSPCQIPQPPSAEDLVPGLPLLPTVILGITGTLFIPSRKLNKLSCF